MFLPYLAADVHRARLLATDLPASGWDVELLVPGDAFQRSEHYEAHASFLAVHVPVHRVEPEWELLFRLVKSRSLGWRAYRPLRRAGDALLEQRRFDLVYFSCSQPMLFHLGVRWQRRYHIPFVFDIHDPWYQPVLPQAKHVPGWKRRIGNSLSRFMEMSTVRAASGMVSVSAGYLQTLNLRYRGHHWVALDRERQITLPFAASERDTLAADHVPAAPRTAARASSRTIVYTGAGGAIMAHSFRTLCRLLRRIRDTHPPHLTGIRIELFGTEPQVGDRVPALTRIAIEEGVQDLVTELPVRLSYLDALRRAKEADGLLVLGVDDPAYSPSKLALYGLCGKPILACMRERSVVDQYFKSYPGLGHLIHFGPGGSDSGHDEDSALRNFLADVASGAGRDSQDFPDEWRSSSMARSHANLFDVCLRSRPSTLVGIAPSRSR